jgi:rhodanese-related sulfurtransferase
MERRTPSDITGNVTMSGTQIVFYIVLAFFIFLYLRRFMMTRSIQRYSPVQAAEKIKGGNAVLLDVRTDAERASSAIKGSIHIPLQRLAQRAEELRRYKGKEIICYCQSGNRSLVAATRLKKAGFAVADMEGGIAEWNLLRG